MIKFKKILTAFYLLVFAIYAISPIIASVPDGFDRQQCQSAEDIPTARLMLIDVLGDEYGRDGAALSASDGDEDDILLKKKRTILSNKVLIDVIFCTSPVLDQPLDGYRVLAADATRPAYYSALHYFVSGISPPALS